MLVSAGQAPRWKNRHPLPQMVCKLQFEAEGRINSFETSSEHEKRARVHFVPALKDGVFVTLRAPEVIKGLEAEV